jgi:hypothetical protein
MSATSASIAGRCSSSIWGAWSSFDQIKCSSSSAASTERAVATLRTVWNCSQSRARRNSSKALTNSGVSILSSVLMPKSSCHYANSGSSRSGGRQDLVERSIKSFHEDGSMVFH